MTAKKSMTLAELWEYLDEKYQWIAMDEDKRIFAYTKQPKTEINTWYGCCPIEIPFTISDMNPDWKQSLVERPKDWSKYVGCLGEFWDGIGVRACGVLINYNSNSEYHFIDMNGWIWANFRPYTVAEIEQLRDIAKEIGL